MAAPRIARVISAVNLGSFRVSSMIVGVQEDGEMIVLGSGHRASQGIKRGYVTDLAAATFAIRDVIERAEKIANTGINSVWVGIAGAGLTSRTAEVEIPLGGRRVDEEDIDQLLTTAKGVIQPEGRVVLHAQPAHYTLDRARGVPSPVGLHAERLGVDIHVMLADASPVRNVTEAVQNAHLHVDGVVGSPIAAGLACLTPEEREIGVALIELGAEITTVSVFVGGMLAGMVSVPMGSGDITDAIASALGIRRFQAERLKCVSGSAIASPADHRELVPVSGGDGEGGPIARHADDKNRIPRAELVSVITAQLSSLTDEIGRALKSMGFTGSGAGARGQQVVLTGGGAEMPGLADHMQQALGRPVRIGKPPLMTGLPEAHATPGFTSLVGLILHAAAEPVDIRRIGQAPRGRGKYRGLGLIGRVIHSVREYF